MFGGLNVCRGGVEGRETGGGGTVGGVAHQAVESCPYGPKDGRRRAERRLAQGEVGLLGLFCWGLVSICCVFCLLFAVCVCVYM